MRQEALEIDFGHLDSSVCDMVLRNHVPPLQGYQAVPQTRGSDAAIGAAFVETAMVELEVYDACISAGRARTLSSHSSVFCDLLNAGMACDMTQNARQIGI